MNDGGTAAFGPNCPSVAKRTGQTDCRVKESATGGEEEDEGERDRWRGGGGAGGGGDEEGGPARLRPRRSVPVSPRMAALAASRAPAFGQAGHAAAAASRRRPCARSESFRRGRTPPGRTVLSGQAATRRCAGAEVSEAAGAETAAAAHRERERARGPGRLR